MVRNYCRIVCNIIYRLTSPIPDPLLLVLGLTQTCFEGSMYLFVFLWVPSLQEASDTFPSTPLPLGYIFSSFMVSMMLGSVLYTAIVSHSLPSTPAAPADSSLTLHAKLSSLVCAVSALALATSVQWDSERVRFWAFCVFEACVGMYYPVQGMLRGSLISNEHRATVSVASHLRLVISNFHDAIPAFIAVPCPSQHLCCGLPAHGCLVGALCGTHRQCCYAGIFVPDDRSRYRQPGGRCMPIRDPHSPSVKFPI